MLNISHVPVPQRLSRYIECATVNDLSQNVGATWTLLPTARFEIRMLIGPAAEDFELSAPEEDGAFSAVSRQSLGVRSWRPCVVLSIALTPLGVLHMPVRDHDFDSLCCVHGHHFIGLRRWRLLRAQVREAATTELKMATFMRWIEEGFLNSDVVYGRAAAIADVAQRMREPAPFSIKDAAARAGLQRRQLERDFRRYLGTSPKRYAGIARFEQVPQLAWQGMALAQIAATLGFTDQAHLSRSVAEITGLAPAALLRRAAGSALAQRMRPFSQGRITHL